MKTPVYGNKLGWVDGRTWPMLVCIGHTLQKNLKNHNLVGGIQPKYRSYITKIQNNSQSSWWDTAQVSVIQYYKYSKQFSI